MNQLLTTKLHIPPTRRGLITRPRLVEQLNAGLHRKLTLISAPAGFGKTTLVSEWVKVLQSPATKGGQPDKRIAWLSLDESDNDLTSFLTYCIAALRTIQGDFAKGALSALYSPQPPPMQAILTSMINEFIAISEPVLLVFDDYHVIDSSQVDETLNFLIEHLPQHLHLVIATRVDPQLPLARLRARGQLTELRAADLRFTSSEAARFLNQAMDLNLSAENIAALENRTEGWIAGLQLAAISIQGQKDSTSSIIHSFSGSHRFILDYLIEEVLEQQSENIQAFLLQTSLLNRLNGSLCNAVIGQNNSQAVLETLERANLFIIPLDGERRWYRYHQLFADLLRQRLQQMRSDQIPALHQRASNWYGQNGFIDEAIEHALRAKDFEQAAHLIEEHADVSWGKGEHAKFRRWLFKLPIESMTARPALCIFQAWYLFTSGQFDTAEQSLQAVEQALDSTFDHATGTLPQNQLLLPDSDRLRLRGRLVAIRAFMDAHRGDVPGMIQRARQALDYLPEQDQVWRSLVAIVLGDIYGFAGDMAAAYEARFEALKACEKAGETYYILLASIKLAITLRSQGRLRQTMAICQQQTHLAKECGLSQTSLVGLLFTIMGEVSAEINDLDGAIHLATKGMDLVEPGVDMVMLGWGYMCLMRVLFSRGDLAGIQRNILKVESIARETNVPDWVMKQIACWQARLWLVQDNLEAASQWAQEHGIATDSDNKPQHEMDFFSLFDYVILARILLAQGRLAEANGLLQNLLTAAEAGGRTTRVIEIRILQALAAQAAGVIDRATRALEHALQLAEPQGFVRIFVDEGPPIAQLLYEAAACGIAPDYTTRLLAAFPLDEVQQAEPLVKKEAATILVEPISERELEVLQLITEGLTNQEIAARLYLSLNTVKVHTRNIYGKLDVKNRTQAVARARTLGILLSN